MALNLPTLCYPWGRISMDTAYIPLPSGEGIKIHRQGQRILSGLVVDTGEEPQDLTIINEDASLRLTPFLPAKPVVIRPSHTLRISPKSLLELSIPVPLVPVLSTVNSVDKENALIQFQGNGLSLTWFGDPMTGEPGFALSTPMDGSRNWKDGGAWEAFCPLRIRNESSDMLSFKRMILRVPYLSLYAWEKGFMTNRLTVSFKGRSQVSQIHISKKLPVQDVPLDLLHEPQQKRDSAILRRSFSFMKTIT